MSTSARPVGSGTSISTGSSRKRCWPSGFEEVLLGPGVKAVEWAERLPFDVPGALRVRLTKSGDRCELAEVANEI